MQHTNDIEARLRKIGATDIERIAQAHYNAFMENVRDLEPTWWQLEESHRDRMIGAMRAAISIMFQPSLDSASGDGVRAQTIEEVAAYFDYKGDLCTQQEYPFGYGPAIYHEIAEQIRALSAVSIPRGEVE